MLSGEAAQTLHAHKETSSLRLKIPLTDCYGGEWEARSLCSENCGVTWEARSLFCDHYWVTWEVRSLCPNWCGGPAWESQALCSDYYGRGTAWECNLMYLHIYIYIFDCKDPHAHVKEEMLNWFGHQPLWSISM